MCYLLQFGKQLLHLCFALFFCLKYNWHEKQTSQLQLKEVISTSEGFFPTYTLHSSSLKLYVFHCIVPDYPIPAGKIKLVFTIQCSKNRYCRSKFIRLPHTFKSNQKTTNKILLLWDLAQITYAFQPLLTNLNEIEAMTFSKGYKWHDYTFWILCWYSTAFLLSSSLVCLESLSSASYRSLRRRAADRSSSSCLMVTCISSSCA